MDEYLRKEGLSWRADADHSICMYTCSFDEVVWVALFCNILILRLAWVDMGNRGVDLVYYLVELGDLGVDSGPCVGDKLFIRKLTSLYLRLTWNFLELV